MSDLHCEACDQLSDRWHNYAMDYARRGNRRGCLANAGFEPGSWSSKISRKLSADVNLSASIAHHRDRINGKKDDTEADHRRRIRVRSRAKVPDYVWMGDPNPDGLASLWKLLTEGVEDRESPGGQEWEPVPGVIVVCKPGYRPGTGAEVGKRILDAGSPTMPSFNDMSEDELLGIDSFKKDRQGNITITTTARWASEQRAKIEGLNKEKLLVSHEISGGLEFVVANIQAQAALLQGFVATLQALFSKAADPAAIDALSGLSETIIEMPRAVLLGSGSDEAA